jgi:hypothetical protein
MTTAKAVLLVGGLFGVIAFAGWFWFVNVYDTADGRCGRGDLEACQVLQAQRDAEAEAAAAEWEAQMQELIDYAAAMEDERGELGRCLLRVGGHNATMRVSGVNAQEICNAWEGTAEVNGETIVWYKTSEELADTVICVIPVGDQDSEDARTVTFLDTGSAYYADYFCNSITLGGEFPL